MVFFLYIPHHVFRFWLSSARNLNTLSGVEHGEQYNILFRTLLCELQSIVAMLVTPTLTLPHQGGGDFRSSLPPCGGGLGWGSTATLERKSL